MSTPLIACPECDLLQRTAPLSRNAVARCSRCESVLYRPYNENLDRPLAYTSAAVVLFVIANLFPIVSLELQGQSTTATLFGMVQALYAQNTPLLAALVFVTTILVPAVELGAMGYLLVSLRIGHVPSRLSTALRLLQTIRPWGMVEVFILGLLVSLAKLSTQATVVPGVAFWTFGGLLLMIAAAVASFDSRAIWARQSLLSTNS